MQRLYFQPPTATDCLTSMWLPSYVMMPRWKGCTIFTTSLLLGIFFFQKQSILFYFIRPSTLFSVLFPCLISFLVVTLYLPIGPTTSNGIGTSNMSYAFQSLWFMFHESHQLVSVSILKSILLSIPCTIFPSYHYCFNSCTPSCITNFEQFWIVLLGNFFPLQVTVF